jgi:hypothetical protein
MEDIYEKVKSLYVSHVYGPVSCDKGLELSNYISSVEGDSIIFLCYRTKAEAKKSFDASNSLKFAKGKKYLVAGNLTEIRNGIYFCTTSRMVKILLDLDDKGYVNELNYVLVESFDIYDINALVISSILRNSQPCLVLLSCSMWSNLAQKNIENIEFPCDNLEILYTKESPAQIAKKINPKSKIIIFGSPKGIVNSNVFVPRGRVYSSDTNIVIDQMHCKSKMCTKHMSDIRANSIDFGKVYRCITKTEFMKLEDNTPENTLLGLDGSILYLLSRGRDPDEIFNNEYFPQVYRDRLAETKTIIKKFIKEDKKDKTIKKIVSMKLGLKAGMVKIKIDSKFKTDRYLYLSSLASAFINNRPNSYGSKESYQPFAGRNDLETMFNVWQSLILESEEAFYLWKDEENIIRKWCKTNMFNVDQMISLFQLIKLNIAKLTNRRLSDDIVADVSTEELNNIKREIIKIYGTSKNWKKFDKSFILPLISNDIVTEFIPIDVHKNKIYMWINKSDLSEVEIERESLDDLFF